MGHTSYMNTATKVLNAMLLPMLVLAFLIPAMTHEAPGFDAGTFAEREATAEARAAAPVNVPTWKSSDAKFGCTEFPVEKIHTNVLIVNQHNERQVISFDEAWDRSHNDTKVDDLWVIGFC